MKYGKYVSGAAITATFAIVAAVTLSANLADAATVNVGASVNMGNVNPGGPMIPAGGMPPGQGANGHWGGNKGGPMVGMMGGGMVRPAVVGKVTAVNGTSLTVVEMAHPGFGSSTPAMATTTFTVDAGSATVLKNNATSSVSAIAVGDLVAVQGTVNGTNVAATSIRDGFEMRMGPAGGEGGQNGFHYGNNASSSNNRNFGSSSPIVGNGQPVIAGSITAINGSSLTITNKSNVTYTVDASNAKIVEGQGTVTISSLSVGDNVIVQGSVSGTSVTASSVIDQKAAGQAANGPASHGGGIFGAIGGFFSHLFGF